MTTKAEFLAAIKAGKPAPEPLPNVPVFSWPGDAVENFIKGLIGFDGRAIKFKSRDKALEWLAAQPEVDNGKKVVFSSIPDISGNITEQEAAEPERAAKINTCITEAILGVGETGSVWVTNDSLTRVSCALLARRLFVLLDAAKIRGSIAEAYGEIQLDKHQYGSFFSGPSATADIEAVRITGAQGPLALTAMIYNCADAPEPPQLIVSPNADVSPWIKEEESE